MQNLKIKFIYILILISTIVGNLFYSVSAATLSAWADAYTVTVGDTVTIYINANGTSVMPLYVSTTLGSITSQPNNGVSDGETKTVTVYASSAGRMEVTISGIASDTTNPGDYDIVRYVQVTVLNKGESGNGSSGGSGGTPPNVSTPSTPPVENNTTTTTTTNNEETEKSTNNLLSSLTVDKGELSPAFDPNITDYTVELDYDVDTINIEAACQDLTASIIEGLGVHELNEGDNGIVIGVRAEDGSVRNYTINAKVAEAPKVTIKYNNEDYTIVSKYKDVTIPETFEETTLKINEQEVKALKSEKYQLTLLYLNKGEENKFYLYDEESSEVLGEFRTLSFNGKIYVVYPIDAKMQNQDHMIFTKVKIGEEEYDGWIYEDEKQKDFYVVYLVNDLGEKAFYRYDSVENSLQRLGSEIIPVEEETENNNYIYYIVVGIGVLVIAAIGYGVYYSTKKKRYQNRKKLQTEEHYFEVDDGDEN